MKVQEHETVSPITAQSKLCGSRKYPYSPGGLLEILKRREVTEANIFFLQETGISRGKGGFKPKISPWEGYGYHWSTTFAY